MAADAGALCGAAAYAGGSRQLILRPVAGENLPDLEDRGVREAAVGVTAPGPLVIDVTGLEFMGCCAFMALADEAVRCRSRGVELRLGSGEPLVGRVVKACGLGGVLPLYPTADAALATTAHW